MRRHQQENGAGKHETRAERTWKGEWHTLPSALVTTFFRFFSFLFFFAAFQFTVEGGFFRLSGKTIDHRKQGPFSRRTRRGQQCGQNIV